jgi:NNP family nitrate/nitrite transporter-like MFS transporter
VTVLIVGMLALGMGNGAVFQLVPQRFGAEIGVMTGLVGMTGGLGGFYLASSLGFSKQITGSYQAGFLIFATLAALALAALTRVKRRWRADWTRREIAAARI